MKWGDGLAHWTKEGTAYLSIAFSWKLPEAFSLACFYRESGLRVLAGGPGLFANKGYLSEVAEIGGNLEEAVARHNINATFASRGCPVGCWFCIVPKFEGKEFTLLPDFTPRPVLCDSNLSRLSVDYQSYIIDRYQKWEVPLKDASSGFDPAAFDSDTRERWRVINQGPWRFAYDEQKERDDVRRALALLEEVPASRKRIYVLIGNEPFESCMDRIQDVIGWGAEPHVQPFIKLNALKKEPQVRHDWNERLLKDVARWANRWVWRKVPFGEYLKNPPKTRIVETRQLEIF